MKHAGSLKVKFTSELLFEARNSGEYNDHREYVKEMFNYYHKVKIKDTMFIDLVFDYHKDGVITVTAHKDCFLAARN